MNPHELRWIELTFEIVHLLSQQVRFATDVQLRVVAVGFDKVDLVNLQ